MGLFTAIFEVYAQKWTDADLVRHAAKGTLFGTTATVATDEEKAKRVWRKLKTLLGGTGMHQLKKVYLSELPDMETVILACTRYALAQNRDILSDYGHPQVLRLTQIAKMVGREKHRMEAFVRFRLTKDGLFYSVVEPDFDVLPLISPHFESRYADQAWLIYDLRRKYGIQYDLQTVQTVELQAHGDPTKPSADILHEKEALYQDLWKDYFRSTNIASRRNLKLHLQHVPKRYWKYLTEKDGGKV